MSYTRPLLMASAVVLLALAAAPAQAFEDGDYVRHLHWRCDHGDREACHVVQLHRECEAGDRRACEISHWRRDCEMGDQFACRRIRTDLW